MERKDAERLFKAERQLREIITKWQLGQYKNWKELFFDLNDVRVEIALTDLESAKIARDIIEYIQYNREKVNKEKLKEMLEKLQKAYEMDRIALKATNIEEKCTSEGSWESPRLALNDVARCVHNLAKVLEEKTKLRVEISKKVYFRGNRETGEKAYYEYEGEEKVKRAAWICNRWKTTIGFLGSETNNQVHKPIVQTQDYEATYCEFDEKGNVEIRAGSAAGHLVHIEPKGDKYRVEYYDRDAAVRGVVRAIIEAEAGGKCQDEPKLVRVVCEVEPEATGKVASAIATATSMDIRLGNGASWTEFLVKHDWEHAAKGVAWKYDVIRTKEESQLERLRLETRMGRAIVQEFNPEWY